MTGGDAFDIDVSVGENARLVVTSTAAEKIYRSLGPPATVNVRLSVAAGGALAWLPQETILFDSAVLHRRIEVDLAGRRAPAPGRAAGVRPHRHGRERAAAANCTTAGACGGTAG